MKRCRIKRECKMHRILGFLLRQDDCQCGVNFDKFKQPGSANVDQAHSIRVKADGLGQVPYAEYCMIKGRHGVFSETYQLLD